MHRTYPLTLEVAQSNGVSVSCHSREMIKSITRRFGHVAPLIPHSFCCLLYENI
ncbi:hypothetical protein HanPI659440_Chr17g0666961 [Helianthus annuus]|nr:hypothetical protein HanPI659440_Chr17g0666961 [Helianthus annuus]